MGGVTGAGAATGAVLGGGVGAIVGAGIGAGVSTVVWLKQDRQATLLKDVFQRPRPEIVPHLVYAGSSSFPSGHSMMSALTYLTLAALLARSQERRRLKAFFLLLAVLVTFMVGVSRVYLGVHWPTDVLAGWMAGTTWALLCWTLARWLQSRKTLEREAEHSVV